MQSEGNLRERRFREGGGLDGGRDDEEEVAALDLLHRGDGESLHDSGYGRGDRGFHLHGLDGGNGASSVDLIALLHRDGDHPGERRGHLARVVRIRALGGLTSTLIDLSRTRIGRIGR